MILKIKLSGKKIHELLLLLGIKGVTNNVRYVIISRKKKRET